jgi:hypothetical protein
MNRVNGKRVVPDEIRTELIYACRADVGEGVGTRVQNRPPDASPGVEFEIGPISGVYVGSVPNIDLEAPDLLYSNRDHPADGYLYVYIADIEHYKETESVELTSNYADLRLESPFFEQLSTELIEIVESLFDINSSQLRLERYPHDGGGVYFLIPLPPEPMGKS